MSAAVEAAATHVAVTAQLVAIGSELLLGDSTDTNSTWISARLKELGISVTRHVSVGDGLEDMIAVLRQACDEADLVLCTGGLGPTQDDLTRNAVAALLEVPLVRDDTMAADIRTYFEQRGRTMPEVNLVQALKPEEARWLPRVGTAPGLVVEVPRASGDVALLFCMPGVPTEMKGMMTADVLPALQARGGLAVTVTRTVRTSGLSESGIAETLADLVAEVEADRSATISFLASGGETRVRVTTTAADRGAALGASEPLVRRIVALLGSGVVGLDDEGVEHAIARRLLDMGLTLAVAESVTGGGVGARLVTVPGSSDWFRGGLITYATETKTMLAGVDARLLAAEGPVASSVVESLAAGAADRLGADVGLAVVGVAGPTGQGGREPGHIAMGFRGPDGTTRSREASTPAASRVDVQRFAASYTLSYLLKRLDAVR